REKIALLERNIDCLADGDADLLAAVSHSAVEALILAQCCVLSAGDRLHLCGSAVNFIRASNVLCHTRENEIVGLCAMVDAARLYRAADFEENHPFIGMRTERI